MSYQEVSRLEAKAQRRYRKFTPQRIQQIQDLVARGETCEQIAATIGVTVGSLKVTCSRLSLRRPYCRRRQARTLGAGRETATFTIDMKYKGQEHSTELRLHQT